MPGYRLACSKGSFASETARFRVVPRLRFTAPVALPRVAPFAPENEARMPSNGCAELRARRPFLRLIAAILLLGLVPAVPGHAQETMASIVVDATTGTVLSAEQATRRWYPASLTKLMTIYLTFDALKNGTLTLDETLTVSENAAHQPEWGIGLGVGDKVTVEDAILAVVVRSANDVATLLAERIAGSEPRFAAMMSLKARALGMTRTVFRNAAGLPDEKQVTTARDMAILAYSLWRDFPEYYHFFDERYVIWNGQALATYNQFLELYEGADGLKTGFTCGSGYNLVASAERDGRRLIGVVLGASNSAMRTGEMTRLFNQAFEAAPAADAPILTALANVTEGTEADSPPFRLPPDQCELGASVAADGTLTGTLPGWAVVFGAYVERAEAEAALATARGLLDGVLSKGRPAIVQRETEGVSRYAALLVGLEQSDAGAACKHLWTQNAYCLALNPETLNNPQALWR
jgi:D-alanyl-D-alanine carboxypeptidase